MDRIGSKTGDTTRHIKLPVDLDAQVKAYAEIHSRSITDTIIWLLDTSLNGPRELRLLNKGRDRK